LGLNQRGFQKPDCRWKRMMLEFDIFHRDMVACPWYAGLVFEP
jgi:hypothetical protein